MLKNSLNSNTNPEISITFRKIIEQNKIDALKKLFHAKKIDDIPAVIIKVNIERAVLENACLLADYNNKMLETDYKHFILDLSDTLFLDSTFLGTIIVFYKKLNAKGGTLSLIIDEEKTTILSQIENFKKIFKIFSSKEDACNNIKSIL